MTDSNGNAAARILVTGSLAFDLIMDFPGNFRDHILMDKSHLINISFLVGELKRQRGGCAGNIAYTMALLGESPRIVAAAGRDFSDYAEWLVSHGVDVSGIAVHSDEQTASCFITADRADNQIIGFHVGAMKRARDLSLRAHASPHTRYCIIAPDDPDAMLRHCREAREGKIPFIFDPSFQVTAMTGEFLLEGAAGAHVLMLNDYEYAVFQDKTGKTPDDLLKLIDFILVTYGDKGSTMYRQGQPPVVIPPARPKAVADLTGAGDAYRGGFLTGLVRNLDLAVCGRMGSVAAAYCIENFGTQNHHYTPDDFARRYAENFDMVALARE